MARERWLHAAFDSPSDVRDALARLATAGVAARDIEVRSSIPLDHDLHPTGLEIRSRVPSMAILGGVLGGAGTLTASGAVNWTGGNIGDNTGGILLVDTTGTLTINRSGGNPPLVRNFTDELYFTDLPTDNTGGVGEVHYTFLALGGQFPFGALKGLHLDGDVHLDVGVQLDRGGERAVILAREGDLPP